MASDNQVFVGAIEYNLDKETLEDEVYKWDGVASVYYKGPTSGWANVSFVSREKRDKFLADKSKHRYVVHIHLICLCAFRDKMKLFLLRNNFARK